MEQKSEKISSEKKQPEILTDEEKYWNSKSPQEKVDILAKNIGHDKLVHLFNMLEILLHGEKTQSSLNSKPKAPENTMSIDKALQELRMREKVSIEVQILLLSLLVFAYKYDQENNTKSAQYYTCSKSSWLKDGIDSSTFETVKGVYDAITSLDKLHPEFIQKNPTGKPLEYIYIPTEEDRKVIAKFFPNLENIKLQIPFSIEYGLDANGRTQKYQKVFKYGSEFLESAQLSKKSDMFISFRQLAEKDNKKLRGTLMNETWHYLYVLSTPRNMNLEDALRGQSLVIGSVSIPLGNYRNGINEYMSDVFSMAIDPVSNIERIYKWGQGMEVDKFTLKNPGATTGYQFCVKVFSAILLDLFGPEYKILRDQQKLSNSIIEDPSFYPPNKLKKILEDPEKIQLIQRKYMEIGQDFAARLGRLKNSPAYTEPVEPKNAVEALMIDMNSHPTGDYFMPPKLPHASSKLGQR